MTKFTSFINPYLEYIDSGKIFRRPFSILYTVLAVLNLLIPIAILIGAIKNDVFDFEFKFILTFILVWFSIIFASWIGFQIWWDRRTKINFSSSHTDDFVATPSFSHFLQTSGEWIGSWIAIVGTCGALFTSLILGSDSYIIDSMIGIPFLDGGFVFVIIAPIYGFLVIILSRFVAEQIRALTSIANNTKQIKEVEVSKSESSTPEI